ncbi:sugar transferase [Paenibacillus sp. J53TS2]|uniref:sugar transferase n=1 Tax=Paenibacillus sp. J53TS2 TaxID=2807197 RepID=UPI001B028B12|nr:sugar transferase [Paenibacillus sp. J53TS2]GIP49236.1 sugar transferase [Paenibacillus sp. J53TS2]
MIKLYRNNGMKAVLLLLDLLVIYASYRLAAALLPQEDLHSPAVLGDSRFRSAPWLGMFTVMTYYFFNLYDLAGRRKPVQFLWNLLLAQLFVAAELIVFGYASNLFSLTPSLLLYAFAAQLLLSFGLRLLLFYIQSKGFSRKKTLAVISNEAPDDEVLRIMLEQGKPWFRVERIVREEGPGMGAALPEQAWEGMETLLIGPGLTPEMKAEWARNAGRRNMEVVIVPDFYELYLADAEPQQIGDLLVYSLMPPQLTLPERAFKRLFDLAVSSMLLLMASPVMLVMFVLIPLTSRGKALYVQERIGLQEKPFPLYKFRSMVDGAETGTGPVLAGRNDTRVTRLGQWIRATRIDELPQLFNVLLGQMSLVGPRPERAFFINRFKEELPHYTYRLMVKPGLTGYAQVMAGYATTPSDKLRYDLMYIKRYSLLLDLKILFQTIRVVVQREQAKGVEAGGGTEMAATSLSTAVAVSPVSASSGTATATTMASTTSLPPS